MKSITLTLAALSITIAPLTVHTAEAASLDYTPEQLQTHGNQNQFGRAFIAASITHIDGKPVSPETDIRAKIKNLRDWNTLEAIYNRLNNIPAVTEGLKDLQSPNFSLPTSELSLPSGRKVRLRNVELAEVEHIELHGAHTSREYLRLRHDLAAAMISHIDDQPVQPTTDLRVELPLFSDWNLLSLAYDQLHKPEDIEAFFA